MRFSSLSSGSRANCIFVESSSARILIDCGLSALQVEKRLASIGVDPKTIDAVLVTHEHRDHVAGLPVWSRRFPKTKVLVNRPTGKRLHGVQNKVEFTTNAPFDLCGMHVVPFAISHDADEPVGFRIESDGVIFALATDLGEVTQRVTDALTGCNGIVIESNHDEEMLKVCSYPWDLKKRILSKEGHLSNHSCGRLLASVMHDELMTLMLGHLSENSNTPALALETVKGYLPERLQKGLCCASRYEVSSMFTVRESLVALPEPELFTVSAV